MFASSYPSSRSSTSSTRSHRAGGLYQQIGVETRLAGANPHQLVAMLFDGYMEAVVQARGALAKGDALVKGQAIGRAVRIIEEGLRAGLDMEAGGSLARDLRDLYEYLVMRLTLANLRNDDALLTECQRLMKPLQEAWAQIADQPAAR
jgi:flagellar secretion chaperone FliS